MNPNNYSRPLPLRQMKITDPFFQRELTLVREQVLPYQWEALNDRIPDAAPSYAMHNFRAAARLNQRKEREGRAFVPPTYTFRGFETLPEDPAHPDPDRFYGFVFQDTDFSKWIEAAAYSLQVHPDEALEATADAAIDLVVSAQGEDGYLDTYYLINGRDRSFTNLRDHHELYCFGHLTEGAVAYFEATGKDKLLRAAMRFADYLDTIFGSEPGKIKGYPGHEIAEMALVRLYELTGKERYLRLAKFFIDERGTKPYYFDSEGHTGSKVAGYVETEPYTYNQAHRPVREQEEAVGHAVRAVYLYSGMADIARITQDEALLAACRKLWDSITKEKMYITGGIGASHIGESFSHPFDLPNDTAYAETCASIGMAFFARRMLEIEADSRYADVLEREVYNGILSGMALDGKRFFYVNPLEVDPVACKRDARKQHVKPVRQRWFGCACCPPNLARFISSIGSYACTESEDTLFMHLYLGGTICKETEKGSAQITVDSNLPWDGRISITVKAKDSGLTIALRIPEWCGGEYRFSSSDVDTELPGYDRENPFSDPGVEAVEPGCGDSIIPGFDGEARFEKGYLYLTKEWGEEEHFLLELPMKVRILTDDPRVRENAGKAAVMRGPLVYCLEEVDNGSMLWNRTIDREAESLVEDWELQGNPANRIRILQDEQLTYIPYYMWANRGENQMQVWTRYSSPLTE